MNDITPLRGPERSWEERQLTLIIVRVAEMLAGGHVGSHTIGRYLIDSMDWFVATRPEPEAAPDVPADPFEAWVVERWLKDIRSDEFQSSVQHERLMAEWERTR